MKPEELKTYVVNADGWISGVWREKGAEVTLTPTAAKYENVSLKPTKTRKAPAAK